MNREIDIIMNILTTQLLQKLILSLILVVPTYGAITLTQDDAGKIRLTDTKTNK